jgi:hypothetical protein
MTLIPAEHNFTIWQGATFFEVLTLYQSNDQSDPRNLTGYDITMTVNPRNKGAAIYPQIVLSTDSQKTSSGCSITLANQTTNPGKMDIKMISTATDKTDNGGLIDWKSASYTLTMTNNNTVDALLRGNIKVVGI